MKGGTKHRFPLPADFFYHLFNELAEVNTVWFLVFWIPLVRLVPTFWILLSQLSGTSQESKKTIPFPTPGLIGIFLVFAWQSWKRRNPAGGPTHSQQENWSTGTWVPSWQLIILFLGFPLSCQVNFLLSATRFF